MLVSRSQRPRDGPPRGGGDECAAARREAHSGNGPDHAVRGRISQAAGEAHWDSLGDHDGRHRRAGTPAEGQPDYAGTGSASAGGEVDAPHGSEAHPEAGTLKQTPKPLPKPKPKPVVVQKPVMAPPATSRSCDIKGNVAKDGERIYHLPGQRYYGATKITPSKGERMFCSESEARDAGWRKSKV